MTRLRLDLVNLGIDEMNPQYATFMDSSAGGLRLDLVNRGGLKYERERFQLLLDGDSLSSRNPLFYYKMCHRLATFMDKRLARGQDIGYRPILSEEGRK